MMISTTNTATIIAQDSPVRPVCVLLYMQPTCSSQNKHITKARPLCSTTTPLQSSRENDPRQLLNPAGIATTTTLTRKNKRIHGPAAKPVITVTPTIRRPQQPPQRHSGKDNSSTVHASSATSTTRRTPRHETPQRPRHQITRHSPLSVPANHPISPTIRHFVTPPKNSNYNNNIIAKVFLIRHGESQGQIRSNTMQRKTDPSLIDCRLTARGHQQAMALANTLPTTNMDLVLCSPLTRALQTAVLAFSCNKIVVQYDLREIGPDVVENQPRPWKQVLHDLEATTGGNAHERIDTQSFAPTHYRWPEHHDQTPRVLRRHHVKGVFVWLAQQLATENQQPGQLATKQQQPQQQQALPNIAVVCHFHVIRAALTNERGFCNPNLKPHNAQPILCYLTRQGQLIQA